MAKGATLAAKQSRNMARWAGLWYILLAICGAFSMMYVPSTLIAQGDGATTVANILSSEGLFRLGIVGAVVTQIVQIFVALSLYNLLKPVNQNQARLMVIFVLLAVPIAIVNELNHAAVLWLLHADGVTHANTEQLHTQVTFFLHLHEHGIMLAQVFWGLWLFPMGWLVYASKNIPKFIGILLILGGLGYVMDVAVFLLLPDFSLRMSEFSFVGEVIFPLWLVIRGVPLEQ